MWSAPALAKASRYGSHGAIIRCTSSGFAVCGRIALTTSGPIEMFGTKWPSMTSTWIQSAPALSTARTSSPSLAKSADRMDGAMIRGRDTALSAIALRLTWRGSGGNAAVACRGRSHRGGRSQLAQFHNALFDALSPSVTATKAQTMTVAAADRERVTRDEADSVL